METAPTKRSTWIALLALTLAALVVRLWGIGYGAPIWEEPDPDIIAHVDQLRGDPVLSTVDAPEQQYPHLLARLAQLLPRRPPAQGDGAPTTLDGHLEAAAWTHVQVRALVALLSCATIPLVFALARRFVAERFALLAALLAATSLLHEHFAQQGRPHGAAVTFFAWTLLACIDVAQRGRWRDFANAGLASALTLATIQSGLAVLLAGLAAWWIAAARERAALPRITLPIALVAVGVVVFYPYYFDGSAGVQDPARHVDESQVLLRFGEHMILRSEFDGSGLRVLALSLWNYEPVLCLLLVLAVIVALFHFRPRSASAAARVVLAFGVPYSLVSCAYGMTFERFALPLLPAFAVFAAWGLERSLGALRPGTARRTASAALLVLLMLPAAACLKLSWLRSRPDTLDLAAQFVAAETASTAWVQPPLDLPLARQRAPRPGGLFTPWARWQAAASEAAALKDARDLRWLLPKPEQRADLAAYLRSLGPGLVVLERFEVRTEHVERAALRSALQRVGELAATFSPDPDPRRTELEFFFQLSDHFNADAHWEHPHFTRRLLSARAIGCVVEVWRLPEVVQPR